MAFDAGVAIAAKSHDVNNAGGARVWTVMAFRAQGVGAHAVHVVTPWLDMTDRAVWRWITKRVVAWAFDGMRLGQRIDQIVMVAGFAINEPGTSHTIGNGSLDFIGKCTGIDACGVGRRAGAVYRVGVATGAFVFVDVVDAAKFGGIKVTAAGGTVFEYPGINSQIVVIGFVLDGPDRGVAGLAIDSRRVAVPAAASFDGGLNLQVAAAVTGLAV